MFNPSREVWICRLHNSQNWLQSSYLVQIEQLIQFRQSELISPVIQFTNQSSPLGQFVMVELIAYRFNLIPPNTLISMCDSVDWWIRSIGTDGVYLHADGSKLIHWDLSAVIWLLMKHDWALLNAHYAEPTTTFTPQKLIAFIELWCHMNIRGYVGWQEVERKGDEGELDHNAIISWKWNDKTMTPSDTTRNDIKKNPTESKWAHLHHITGICRK